jgi:hypothetical protein
MKSRFLWNHLPIAINPHNSIIPSQSPENKAVRAGLSKSKSHRDRPQIKTRPTTEIHGIIGSVGVGFYWDIFGLGMVCG